MSGLRPREEVAVPDLLELPPPSLAVGEWPAMWLWPSSQGSPRVAKSGVAEVSVSQGDVASEDEQFAVAMGRDQQLRAKTEKVAPSGMYEHAPILAACVHLAPMRRSASIESVSTTHDSPLLPFLKHPRLSSQSLWGSLDLEVSPQ
mmetsp:Transcript_24510/g.59489  ORF Transcript_24510/g.59489 Transcript_24510/m.59489 type:complete len:146 (+) Transcript_24510:169-606(+)